MNAEYRAYKEGLGKINSNLSARAAAILPSPYKQSDAENLYQRLISLVPVGTPVAATYLPDASRPAGMKTLIGEVTGHAAINKSEPHFHVRMKNNSTILLPGSVLEAL